MFFERFCNELIDVMDVGIEMIVSILIIGLKLSPFASALSRQAPKSMEELNLMAQQYIHEEEMNSMKGGGWVHGPDKPRSNKDQGRRAREQRSSPPRRCSESRALRIVFQKDQVLEISPKRT
ncbi:hypothetical protein BUALT_Bualt02G0110800 [Buddleja alternifolia]|uniref:Uncharacterized protein n=1 Tax=Buddleja alternifolia TaxID=168488 RepID=A0AAV6XZC6_9LAMI|nr:hypothetical protein BUALT_Bualt02G0110800 [Buddleja alternifolia]